MALLHHLLSLRFIFLHCSWDLLASAGHCILVWCSLLYHFCIHHKASVNAMGYTCSLYFPSLFYLLLISAGGGRGGGGGGLGGREASYIIHNREQYFKTRKPVT